jgi:hypothetical protein
LIQHARREKNLKSESFKGSNLQGTFKTAALCLLLMNLIACSGKQEIKRPETIVLKDSQKVYIYTCNNGVCPEIYEEQINEDGGTQRSFVSPSHLDGWFLISPAYLLEIRDTLEECGRD